MTEYSFRAAFYCGPLLVSLCLLFFLRQIWHRCQSQVSDHQMRLSFFIPRKPFETQILSLSLPPSHFPSCCCWHPFGLYKSKWASATHCVPACRAHLAFKQPVGGPALFLQHYHVMDIHLVLTFAPGCFCFELRSPPECC